MKNPAFVVLVLLLIACGPKPEREVLYIVSHTQFEGFVSNQGYRMSDYNKFIIIPGSGCSGCISAAELYFYEHHNDPKILFVFTAIEDPKMLKLRFKDEYLAFNNVIFDDYDDLINLRYSSFYPCVATMTSKMSDSLMFYLFE